MGGGPVRGDDLGGAAGSGEGSTCTTTQATPTPFNLPRIPVVSAGSEGLCGGFWHRGDRAHGMASPNISPRKIGPIPLKKLVGAALLVCLYALYTAGWPVFRRECLRAALGAFIHTT